jgi:hypothetical protein
MKESSSSVQKKICLITQHCWIWSAYWNIHPALYSIFGMRKVQCHRRSKSYRIISHILLDVAHGNVGVGNSLHSCHRKPPGSRISWGYPFLFQAAMCLQSLTVYYWFKFTFYSSDPLWNNSATSIYIHGEWHLFLKLTVI